MGGKPLGLVPDVPESDAMKITSERTNKAGKRIVTVELDHGETLTAFSRNQFYKLGEPLGDVIYGSAIIDSWRAEWDQVGQEWIV